MTTALIKSRKHKQKLFSKKLRNPSPENKEKFKSYNSMYTKLIRKARQKYYNDKFKNPAQEGVCDKCGNIEFTRRDDDNETTVAARLDSYHKQTAPLLPYYAEKGKLISLDGMLDINEVTKNIEEALKALT